MKNAAALFDVSAIALSGLCLLHCLALPLLAALLPLFGIARCPPAATARRHAH